MFLLAIGRLHVVNFFLHAYKNFWAIFYFFLLSTKTGSVGSVLPEIKLVWPNIILHGNLFCRAFTRTTKCNKTNPRAADGRCFFLSLLVIPVKVFYSRHSLSHKQGTE